MANTKGRRIVKRTCPHCEILFIKTKRSMFFCSTECNREYRRNQLIELGYRYMNLDKQGWYKKEPATEEDESNGILEEKK